MTEWSRERLRSIPVLVSAAVAAFAFASVSVCVALTHVRGDGPIPSWIVGTASAGVWLSVAVAVTAIAVHRALHRHHRDEPDDTQEEES